MARKINQSLFTRNVMACLRARKQCDHLEPVDDDLIADMMRGGYDADAVAAAIVGERKADQKS